MSKKKFFIRHLPAIIITFVILIVLISLVLIWGNHEIKRQLPIKYEAEVKKYATEYELDEYFVYAVICAESSFNCEAQSHAGAKGLMQLMPATAKDMKESYQLDVDPENLFDPETNIRLGCQYLRYLSDIYNGNTQLILAAYNGGLGNVDRWLKNPAYSSDGKTLTNIPFKETANYVEKVSTYYDLYKKIYN